MSTALLNYTVIYKQHNLKGNFISLNVYAKQNKRKG